MDTMIAPNGTFGTFIDLVRPSEQGDCVAQEEVSGADSRKVVGCALLEVEKGPLESEAPRSRARFPYDEYGVTWLVE